LNELRISERPAMTDLPLGKKTAALKVVLDAMPGAAAEPMKASRGCVPLVILYKLAGKMFAILSVRDEEFVLVKAQPETIELLKEQYSGVGHRSHLDRRFWIAVSLDADVPAKEIKRLVRESYALVVAGLTKKQKAELAAL
jgi:predicted DNA-binding protein (MmcQ/YjbR family)